MTKYVIIGNGTAAVSCIEGIRSVDKTGTVTVISKERHNAYCRPLISYFLENKTTEKKMTCRDENFYSENGCNVIYGEAVRIDAEKKCIYTDKEDTVFYDKLCIAAGSSPFVPPMENLDKVEKKFSFMTLDDAVALKKEVTAESRVLIVGAGLIGLKCAEGLRFTTEKITVCDLSDHVLSSILDFEDASIVQKHLEANGIKFSLNNSVTRFENNTAVMKNGEKIPFDILVTAVGVRANTAIFKEAGGICGRGITVNEKCETSLKDVYAAGDCTETTDVTDGTTKIMALMPNANLQGTVAGVNMAGGERSFDNAILMNSIGFFGLHLMTAGIRKGNVAETNENGAVKKIFFEDNRIVGFVLIGDTRNAGIYTNFIRNRIPADDILEEKLKDMPNISLYNDEMRRNFLESVV